MTNKNEVQTIRITEGPKGGTFCLTFHGCTSPKLRHDATQAEIQAAVWELEKAVFAKAREQARARLVNRILLAVFILVLLAALPSLIIVYLTGDIPWKFWLE